MAKTFSEVRSLRPLRLLIVSRDSRFVRLATFLFERRGWAVNTARRSSVLQGLVEAYGPDIVVLDLSGSSGCAQPPQTVTASQGRSVPVVQVVDDHSPLCDLEHGRLPKWGSFDLLVQRIRDLGRSGPPCRPCAETEGEG